MLRLVTFTGADSATSIDDMCRLHARHRWVEFGILASKGSMGNTRFPTLDWIEKLHGLGLKLSLHICGRWVRRLLLGGNELPELLTNMCQDNVFQRVQLNYHAEDLPVVDGGFPDKLRDLTRGYVIHQIDGVRGQRYLELGGGIPLYDHSGGAGVIPEAWPAPLEGYPFHGYAGGLGPQNVTYELGCIFAVANGVDLWIDMETHVRDSMDRFDISLCDKVCDYVKPFVRG